MCRDGREDGEGGDARERKREIRRKTETRQRRETERERERERRQGTRRRGRVKNALFFFHPADENGGLVRQSGEGDRRG